MIKKCKWCKKEKDMKGKREYCNAKCKKAYENSKRNAPQTKAIGSKLKPSADPINRPQDLNEIAGQYWDKVSPILIKRGHLNILSEDAFAELCDLHSRIKDINAMINNGAIQKCEGCGQEIKIPGNRSLLQLDDKWDNKAGTETQSFKESALSDLKRKYSKQFLDYCKSFYLTPLSNRGNFGLDEEKDDKQEKDNHFDD